MYSSFRPHQGHMGADGFQGHYETNIRAPYAPPNPYANPYGYGVDPAAMNASAASGRTALDPNVIASGISNIAAAALQAGSSVSQARAARWQAVTAGVPGVTPPGQRPDYYAMMPGGAPPVSPQTISALPAVPPAVAPAPEAGTPGWVVALGALAALAAVGGIAYTLTK